MSHHTIVIATGGSGGHVIPAEQLGAKLKTLGCQVTILGHGVEKNPYFSSHIELEKIDIPASAPSLKKSIYFVAQTSKGFIKALRMFKKIKPSVVVGFGSFHSFPVLLAAKFLKIPLALYESNTHLGRVIGLFAKNAQILASPMTSFNHFKNFIRVAPLIKTSLVSEKMTRKEILAYFSLNSAKKTLLILGGSQGSQFLNESVLIPLLKSLDPSVWQVIHIAGHKGEQSKILKAYNSYGIQVCLKAYETHMEYAYSLCDLIISRSGATTLLEIDAHQKPVILIPFLHSQNNHQLHNALHFTQFHPGVVIEEPACIGVDFKVLIEQLLQSSSLIEPCSANTTTILFEQKVIQLCLS